ncbi:MAG: protease HtpX [Gammaproteobacteria bacterium]|nr:protease HtpX [Gammaproteobacteria bacterium]
MKRILLLIVTNLAVVLVLSVVTHLLGVDQYLAARGSNIGALLIGAAVIGFGGAFISLAMSKFMARQMMGVQIIKSPSSPDEQWLLSTVRAQAEQAGIGMPEVGVFDSPAPNAFATGARRDAALVAVSTGLLRSMNRQEVEAVLGHEISHVANGDMVTLTLIQGVVNTFVIFLSRLIGGIVDRAVSRSSDDRPGMAYFLTSLVCQIVLGLIATMIVMWFSRRREFRADAGGARLAGKNAMIAALERLKSAHEGGLPKPMQAFGISGGGNGLRTLFMSHPPLEQRIAALRQS